MRRMILVLTAILAPTAVMASVPGGVVGDSEFGVPAAVIQERQLAPSGGAAIGQRGFLVLAKGDQAGNGPGAGGHKGEKKGGYRGKQKEGKDNPNKGKK